jgi:methylated-DNA-protein-cysteine methyltransferase related protein
MKNGCRLFRNGTSRHKASCIAAEKKRHAASNFEGLVPERQTGARRKTSVMPNESKGGWNYIYRMVKQIPRGSVTTYGQLARMLHVPGGARTVGFAMAGCPSGQGIPWHRVVGAGGKLLPHEPYASKQRMLLETEGTTFLGMKVNFAAHEWKPGKSGPAARKRRKKLRTRRKFAKRR